MDSSRRSTSRWLCRSRLTSGGSARAAVIASAAARSLAEELPRFVGVLRGHGHVIGPTRAGVGGNAALHQHARDASVIQPLLDEFGDRLIVSSLDPHVIAHGALLRTVALRWRATAVLEDSRSQF